MAIGRKDGSVVPSDVLASLLSRSLSNNPKDRQPRRCCAAILFVGLFLLSAVATPEIQNVVGRFFVTADKLGMLRNFFVTLGAALVGATAIGFSVVMFAVQMNFARTPYSLFRKLSSDFTLLGAFAATFFLALGVGTASLIPDVSWVAIALVFAGWATILILIFFFYAYRRALTLINPLQ